MDLRLLGVIGMSFLLLAQRAVADEPAGKPGKFRVYIGTYTGAKSKGIYRSVLDLETGKLSEPTLAGEAANPSFIGLHPSGKYLYAVSEVGEFKGKPSGAIAAFAIKGSGDLQALNQQPSGGSGPCHLVVDAKGKNVLAANYGGGSCCVIPIETDGKLAEPSCVVQHKGSSVNKERQEAPHAHSINLDAANRYAVCCDLGLDKVFVYKFDPEAGKLMPNSFPALVMTPGAGPRHFAFHPDGKAAYVINELAQTLTACSYDPENGVLKRLNEVPSLPDPVAGNSTADVHVHPSGKFVYGSNRGYNSIASFRVDPATYELSVLGQQRHDIKVPRNFAIDPTGKYLLVANQAGDSVVVFSINQRTGALTPTGSQIEVGAPVCLQMMRE